MSTPPQNPGPGRPIGSGLGVGSGTQQKLWKWDLAIRYQISNPNCSLQDVADHVGVAYQTVATWQTDPDYKVRANQIRTHVLSHLDEEICENVKTQRLALKKAVPLAIQRLIDYASQNSNPNVAIKACAEILDRDGNLAKVSRVGLPTEDQGGVSDQIDNNVAATLVAALQTAQAAKQKKATLDSNPPTDSIQ